LKIATEALKIKIRIENRWQQFIFEETSFNTVWSDKTETGE